MLYMGHIQHRQFEKTYLKFSYNMAKENCAIWVWFSKQVLCVSKTKKLILFQRF
jgi:hypothetical protein